MLRACVATAAITPCFDIAPDIVFITNIPWAGAMKAFSELVGRIYDAAVAPHIWTEAIDGVRRFLDAEVGILSSFDAYDADSWNWQYAVGFEPAYLQAYREKYMAMNPWMDLVATLGSGETTYVSAHDSYRAIEQSEFYLEWLKPQRLVDAAILMIDKSPSAVAIVVVSRTEGQGFFDQASLERFALVYPHLRRSAAIGRIIGGAENRAETLAGALDALAAGLFLLDDQGQIVHANRSGAAMLAAKAPVVSIRGRLEFAGDGVTPLRSILEAGRGAAPRAASGASHPLAAGGKAFVAHIIALDAARRDGLSAERRATVLVLVKEANPTTAAAVEATARCYGLTPQESRVLRMVVDAGGIPLAADALNLSPTTVRTHIARIYDKTGVHSQGQLIKLLSEMASPLRAAARAEDGGPPP
jgi:DNA-binding CsgD family transcriptional regulator/PAS domain-containing protein